MKVKLSEIFVPLTDKNIYTAEELSDLNLQLDFIKKMAAEFNLIYVDNVANEGNLCFAENKEVRQEYRMTFSKEDVATLIFAKPSVETVNMEIDVVRFPKEFFF